MLLAYVEIKHHQQLCIDNNTGNRKIYILHYFKQIFGSEGLLVSSFHHVIIAVQISVADLNIRNMKKKTKTTSQPIDETGNKFLIE